MDELPWILQAKKLLGITEVKGNLDNPFIIQLYKEVGHEWVKHDEVPWCAALVGAMLERSGIPSTRSLAARSYEQWGLKLTEPVYGCVGVKVRQGTGWEGHVGFVVGANQGSIYLLGGNQNDSVSIAQFPRSSFTAFRWPANTPITVRNMPVNLVSAGATVREA